MNWREWVIDAAMGDGAGRPFCLVPYEGGILVLGMNVLGLEPPSGGRLVGIYHETEEQARAFAIEHEARLRPLFPNGCTLLWGMKMGVEMVVTKGGVPS